MSMVGVMTFHASHNFGSMLQAYATQTIIEKWGHNCEIINFRMPTQKDYYSLYKSMKFGTVNCLGDVFMFPFQKKRREAYTKFENFMTSYFHLTQEYNSLDELKNVSDRYDVYVAGSDQIWSRSIPEFIRSDIDYTDAYYLNFSNEDRRRISFATSVGEATLADLEQKKKLLNRFEHISSREEKGARLIESITGKYVPTVLDPTLLLNKNEWLNLINQDRVINKRYVLLYTLKGIRPGMKWAKNLYGFAKNNDLEIVCISPFFPVIYPGIHNVMNCGPLDFLNLISNAEVVFTDSFHGTAFSLNFEKPIYSYIGKGSKDNRKSGLLHIIGAENRSLASFEEIQGIKEYRMNYQQVGRKLDEKRKESLKILEDFL